MRPCTHGQRHAAGMPAGLPAAGQGACPKLWGTALPPTAAFSTHTHTCANRCIQHTHLGRALHMLRVKVLQHVDFIGGGQDAFCQVPLAQQRVHHR